MSKSIRVIILICISLITIQAIYAKSNKGFTLKEICSLSGGSWFGVESGYWSCCWANWGCLQCEPDNTCEMVCETEKCRDANDQQIIQPPKPGYTVIKGLTPKYVKPPVIPKKPKPMIRIPLTPKKKIQQNRKVIK